MVVVPVVVGDVVLDVEDVVVVVNGSSEGPVTNHDEITEKSSSKEGGVAKKSHRAQNTKRSGK